jgi:hypothetical protein
MPIRKRLAVANPQAFNEDAAIRFAFQVGLQKLQHQRADALEFSDKSDTELMNMDRRIAFLERSLQHDGNLSLVVKN